MPKKSRRHPKPESHPLDLKFYDRVRASLPVARKMLEDGLSDARCEWSEDIPCDEPSGLNDSQIDELVEWTGAVYAVGVAVGLLLRPEMFLNGGAR